MKDRKPAQRSKWYLVVWLISVVALILALLEFVPVFTALRAGIAGLSIIIFGPLALFAGICTVAAWRQGLRKLSLAALATTILALTALYLPIAALGPVSQKNGAALHFNLNSYLSFTGDSVAPSKTVTYKVVDGQSLKLALYGNDTSTAQPAVILLHGGGWQYGDYQRTNNWPQLLSDAGYRVISVNYRLASPDVPTWSKAPEDVQDAVTYIKANALQLGVDPDHLALLGQSAGGHLALLAAYSSPDIRAVVGLYAPTDLAADYNDSIDKDSELAFIGGTPADYPERYEMVSVPDAVSPTSPPTLLIQGTSDDMVKASSSTLLSERLKRFDIRHQLVLLPYVGHSFDNQVGGFATQIAEQSTLDFLSETLR